MSAAGPLSRDARAELFRALNERRRSTRAAPRIVPVARDERAMPLAPAQQRFWVLQQLAGDSGVYNVALRLRLRGTLDRDALDAALRALVARHEILRTSYHLVDGVPMQRVEAFTPSIDEGASPERPFDLATPPFRAGLERLADDEHVLIIVVHHIATDLVSMQILVRELAALYARAPLPPPALQFADVAHWQRQWLEGEDAARQRAFWRERLARPPGPLEIPADRPRPVTQTYRGGSVEAQLEPPLMRALQTLARAEEATPFMLLLAAWRVLLHRLTGTRDIVIGAPVAARTRTELEGVVGPLLNTLALRGSIAPRQSCRTLLRRERDAVLGALANQELPFEELEAPAFRTLFAMQNAPAATVAPGALDVSVLPAPVTTAMADLTLTVVDSTVTLGYAGDLFDEATAARYLRAYVTLLEGVAAHPDRAIETLPLAHEPPRIGAGARVWSVPSLARRFDAAAARHPERPAVTCEAPALRYRELSVRANRLAHDLIARGVGAEVRVGLEMARGIDMLVAILAVLKAGGAYVPIDPHYPEERRRFIAEDAGLAFVLSDARAESTDEANPDVDIDPDNAAYVIYTSGSTGQPKGCIVTHANVNTLMGAAEELFVFDEHDVWSLFHSYAFDFSVWEIWGALLHGARLVVVPQDVTRAPDAFAELLVRERVTVLSQTPSAFRALAALGPQTGALRYIVFGGEALDPRMLRPWVERYGDETPQLINMYGITETSVHVTFRRLRAVEIARCGSVIGEPLASHEIHLADDHLQPVLRGVPGEILVGGDCVARGYLDRPDLTALRFVPDPFGGRAGARLYRSGDRARLRNDGELEFLGRIDGQVKVRGYRIETGEIEAAIAAAAGVTEAVVVAREDALVAYVVPRGVFDASAVRASLARKVPDYMVPAAFVALDRIPLTPHGKLDRAALPVAHSAGAVEGEPPRGTTEQALAAIWRELLEVESIARDANFFAAGGHSLLAVRLVERIRATLGVSLPMASMLRAPTIAGLAELLDARSTERPLVVRFRERSGTALVLVHGGGGGVSAYGELARHLAAAILGVRARGLEKGEAPQASIEEMATTYLAALPERRLLAGWSLGGTIAFEMARQSRAERVVLIDAPQPGHVERVPEDLVVPNDVTEELAARWRALMEAHLQALARYAPEPFDGEVVLIRAERRAVDLDWRRLAPRLREIDVPGDHYAMLRAPHVERLARVLEQLL